MTVKTLFLFEKMFEETTFFELEGDYSHLHDVYINGSPQSDNNTFTKDQYSALESELDTLIFHQETGHRIVTSLTSPTRDWTHFVRCGWSD